MSRDIELSEGDQRIIDAVTASVLTLAEEFLRTRDAYNKVLIKQRSHPHLFMQDDPDLDALLQGDGVTMPTIFDYNPDLKNCEPLAPFLENCDPTLVGLEIATQSSYKALIKSIKSHLYEDHDIFVPEDEDLQEKETIIFKAILTNAKYKAGQNLERPAQPEQNPEAPEQTPESFDRVLIP